jgi:hypothetical protein
MRHVFCLLADDDSDSEDEEYTIVYEVPFHNATRELKLSCTTTFAGFLTAVSRKMEVGVTHLSAIGYVASYKPKNPKPVPKLLETSEDYESLMADITEYRKDCLKKMGGKVKPFSISLTNTSNTPTDGRKVRAEVVIYQDGGIYLSYCSEHFKEKSYAACSTSRGQRATRA